MLNTGLRMSTSALGSACVCPWPCPSPQIGGMPRPLSSSPNEEGRGHSGKSGMCSWHFREWTGCLTDLSLQTHGTGSWNSCRQYLNGGTSKYITIPASFLVDLPTRPTQKAEEPFLSVCSLVRDTLDNQHRKSVREELWIADWKN